MDSSPSAKTALSRATCLVAAGAGLLSAAQAEVPRHVVLVHGIWDTAWTLRAMERAIRDAGLQPTMVTLTPNDGRAPLDVLGAQVHEQIRDVIPSGERFSMVGFSMGGLVARSYLRQFGEPDRMHTFVSIASPHRGTLLARFHWLPGVRDMIPGSAFLRSIDEDAPRYSNTRWVTIRTPLDLMIVPSDSSALEWAENHSFPVVAHPLLAVDGRVITCVLSALGVSTMSAPDAPASRRAEWRPRRIPGIRRHR